MTADIRFISYLLCFLVFQSHAHLTALKSQFSQENNKLIGIVSVEHSSWIIKYHCIQLSYFHRNLPWKNFFMKRQCKLLRSSSSKRTLAAIGNLDILKFSERAFWNLDKNQATKYMNKIIWLIKLPNDLYIYDICSVLQSVRTFMRWWTEIDLVRVILLNPWTGPLHGSTFLNFTVFSLVYLWLFGTNVYTFSGADLGGGCRGCAPPSPPPLGWPVDF